MASKTIKGITVVINGKTTGLAEAMEKVKSKSIALGKELKECNKALKLNPDSTTLLAEKQGILADAVKAARDELKQLENVQDQITAQYEAGEIDRGAYLQYCTELEKARQNLERLEDQQRQFGGVVGQVMQQAGQKVSEFSDKITDAGKAFAPISAGAAAAGTAAVAAFAEVDNGVDAIIKATGASGDQLDSLVESYENVATSIPAALGDVADGIGEVNTRFQSTGEELEAQTALFLKFAEITGGDLVASVDAADKAMEAWGVSADRLPGFLGMVAAKAQETGINAQALMQDVQANSASFKALGFTLEESINFMAQLDANGVDGATALAGLKKAVVNLTDAGMSEEEALRQVIASIKDATTETEALEAAQEVFGTKGAAEMAIAIREGRIDLDNLTGSMEEYANIVGDTYAETVDGIDEFTTAANAGKIALAQFGSTISDMVAPLLRGATELLKNANESLQNMDDGQKKTIVTMGAVVAAAAPLLMIVGKIGSGVGTLITVGGKVAGACSSASAAFKAAGGAAGIMQGATTALSGALSFLAANPIVLIVAGIAALVAGIVWAYNKFEWFRDGVNAVGAAIQAGFTWAMEGVQNAASTCMEAAEATVQERLANMQLAYEAHGGGIQGILAAAWEGITGIFTFGFDFLDNLTGGKLSEILLKFDLLSGARTTVSNIMENIRGSFAEKIDAAREAIHQGIENIKSLFYFEWSLPHLKLPHFHISGGFSLNPPSAPHFSVDWYARGGVLYGAQLFGQLGGRLLGGGEAGPEAVLPLSSFYSELAAILDARLAGLSPGGAPLVEQHNNYYSPQQPTPAEYARQTREATRKAIAAIKRR